VGGRKSGVGDRIIPVFDFGKPSSNDELTLSCQKSPQGILAKANPRYEAGKYDEGLDNPQPTAGDWRRMRVDDRAPKMRVDFP
jgi:hypothetical protein